MARALIPKDSADSNVAPSSVFVPASNAEIETLLVELSNTKDELNALLKTERHRFSELSQEVERLIARLESQESNPSPQQNTRRNNDRTLGETEYGKDVLVTAGLTEIEAERVLELQEQARSRIQELLEDPENRDRNTIREAIQETSKQIRSELGDYGYETYLSATGQDISVPVGSVEPDSAGAVAGIQAGDQIISYAGERVFDISDLQAVTTSGIEGTSVVVELVRDDQPVTLVIPRGQIGISTRNRRDR